MYEIQTSFGFQTLKVLLNNLSSEEGIDAKLTLPAAVIFSCFIVTEMKGNQDLLVLVCLSF